MFSSLDVASRSIQKMCQPSEESNPIKEPISTLNEVMKQCGFTFYVNKQRTRKHATPLGENEKKSLKPAYYEFHSATFQRNKVRAMQGW